MYESKTRSHRGLKALVCLQRHKVPTGYTAHHQTLKRLDNLFSAIALYIYEYDNETQNSFFPPFALWVRVRAWALFSCQICNKFSLHFLICTSHRGVQVGVQLQCEHTNVPAHLNGVSRLCSGWCQQNDKNWGIDRVIYQWWLATF